LLELTDGIKSQNMLNLEGFYLIRSRSTSEVSFTSIDSGRTRVDLEHRHMERHGPSGERLRDAVDDPNGWTFVLGQYATWANENANSQNRSEK
jgi:hypothetical protein